MNQTIIPKKRIESIDALRGFALFGILMFHCMEHFDLMIPGRQLSSPFLQQMDNMVYEVVAFLFSGKAYAIFSLLFGLSFFMQMDSQAAKGVDFRWRFVWRLTLLFILGYLNGLVYMGEFFVVYAILGLVMIPLFKVKTKWLVLLSFILCLQIPDIIAFISLVSGNSPNEPTFLVSYMDQLYQECAIVFTQGSFAEVIQFNAWKGQGAKLLWVFNNARYPQLIGLFTLGMLIGRYGVHKSEAKIIYYSRKVLPYALACFIVFYAIILFMPLLGVEGFALRAGTTLFKSYANLSMMVIYVTGFMLLYYQTKAKATLNKIAPVGKMSVTNYMLQGLVGVCLFYGFGGNLAVQLTFFESLLIGLVLFAIQVFYSNWWTKRFYFGPVEWVWRVLTWFKAIPIKR